MAHNHRSAGNPQVAAAKANIWAKTTQDVLDEWMPFDEQDADARQRFQADLEDLELHRNEAFLGNDDAGRRKKNAAALKADKNKIKKLHETVIYYYTESDRKRRMSGKRSLHPEHYMQGLPISPSRRSPTHTPPSPHSEDGHQRLHDDHDSGSRHPPQRSIFQKLFRPAPKKEIEGPTLAEAREHILERRASYDGSPPKQMAIMNEPHSYSHDIPRSAHALGHPQPPPKQYHDRERDRDRERERERAMERERGEYPSAPPMDKYNTTSSSRHHRERTGSTRDPSHRSHRDKDRERERERDRDKDREREKDDEYYRSKHRSSRRKRSEDPGEGGEPTGEHRRHRSRRDYSRDRDRDRDGHRSSHRKHRSDTGHHKSRSKRTEKEPSGDDHGEDGFKDAEAGDGEGGERPGDQLSVDEQLQGSLNVGGHEVD